MHITHHASLQIDHEITLSKKDYPTTSQERERMSRILYASTVGSIMYAMTCTRPDVAYSLGVVSRYQSDPDENYWKVVKTILKYLWNTKDQWLIYGESDLKLVEFTESSFQSDHDDSKNVSGYIYILNGRAICWKNFKQHIMTDSTCEIEYIAVSDAAKEACGYESSSMSLEWHPPLMASSYYTTIVLVPLLKWRNQSHISGPSTFCAATT